MRTRELGIKFSELLVVSVSLVQQIMNSELPVCENFNFSWFIVDVRLDISGVPYSIYS